MVLEFMGALYNEEEALPSLVKHVKPYVWMINFVDDGSTDDTVGTLMRYYYGEPWEKAHINFRIIQHTGLPETVKREALKLCKPNSWVIMLDADERFADGVLDQIKDFVNSPMADEYTHVWFTLHEFIDGLYAGRSFLKCRLFKAWAAHFSDTVHVDDWFDGQGANFNWTVVHSKTTEKQTMREKEYIETYKKLVSEGKMTEEQMQRSRSMHYFVK